MEFSQSSDGLSEQIAKYIAEQIITGELVEGERIQELRIVKELDVSRGSVREALLLLQRTYLIDIFPRRGAIVTEMSAEQTRALFESCAVVLKYIVQKLTETWRQQESQEMQSLLERLIETEHANDIEEFYNQVFAFFQQQSEKSTNIYIKSMFQTLLPSIRRSYFFLLSTSRRELHDALSTFQLVIEAVLMRKPRQAEIFVDEFCQLVANQVVETLSKMKQVELAWAKRGHRQL